MGVKTAQPFATRRGSLIPVHGPADLAIDPGLHTGWALFENASLVACGTGSPPFENVRCLVIELPQAYPKSPIPYQDVVTLAFQAGRYAGSAGADIEVRMVLPHSWKGNLPKDVYAGRVRSRLSAMELSVLRECESAVPQKQMHNVLDAVGIGQFAFLHKI